jgi:hypothetical protein
MCMPVLRMQEARMGLASVVTAAHTKLHHISLVAQVMAYLGPLQVRELMGAGAWTIAD